MKFRGEYSFLSNMYPCSIKIGENVYSCSEAAFQAFKCKNKEDKLKFIGLNGYESKRLGRKIKMVEDWNNKREDVMKFVLEIKFESPELMGKLKSVKDIIVEDNDWGDKFWGRCNNIGENKLGKILMEIRDGI